MLSFSTKMGRLKMMKNASSGTDDLRVHTPGSVLQSAEIVQFFCYVAVMFAEIELRVQMNP